MRPPAVRVIQAAIVHVTLDVVPRRHAVLRRAVLQSVQQRIEAAGRSVTLLVIG